MKCRSYLQNPRRECWWVLFDFSFSPEECLPHVFPPAGETETPGWLSGVWVVVEQIAPEAAKHPGVCWLPVCPSQSGIPGGCCWGAPCPLAIHTLVCITDNPSQEKRNHSGY